MAKQVIRIKGNNKTVKKEERLTYAYETLPWIEDILESDLHRNGEVVSKWNLKDGKNIEWSMKYNYDYEALTIAVDMYHRIIMFIEWLRTHKIYAAIQKK